MIYQGMKRGGMMTNGLVKSAARVMAIFECFEDVKRPLTISELVRLMGVPQSSMSALMKSLLAQGFVDYDTRARTYTPSVRVALLGSWLMGGAQNNDNLLGMMQDLNSATGDTVVLGVLNGVETQYIHVVNSYQRLRFHLRPGMMRPMFRTAVGLVLASLRDDAELGRMVRRVNTEAERPEDLIQETDVMARIQEARDQGYLITSNLATPGAGMIATLVRNGPSTRPLAIGIGAPNARLVSGREFLVENLMAAIEKYTNGKTVRAA
jgi:DNA-binding IclR family transcriptional regulator